MGHTPDIQPPAALVGVVSVATSHFVFDDTFLRGHGDHVYGGCEQPKGEYLIPTRTDGNTPDIQPPTALVAVVSVATSHFVFDDTFYVATETTSTGALDNRTGNIPYRQEPKRYTPISQLSTAQFRPKLDSLPSESVCRFLHGVLEFGPMGDRRAKPHRLDPSSYVGRVAISFTACVDHRMKVFFHPADIEPHIEILREQFERFDCMIPIYCFMPDHLHIISMGMTDFADGKRAMDAFKSKSGQLLKSTGDRFRWQENYYDRIVRHSEDWRKKVFYVFNNPVRAGLSEEPRSYPLTGSIGYDLEQLIYDSGQ